MLVIGGFFTLNHDRYIIDNIMNSKSNNDENILITTESPLIKVRLELKTITLI